VDFDLNIKPNNFANNVWNNCLNNQTYSDGLKFR